MDEPSPYQTPRPHDPPPIHYAAQGDPPAVKVLGILHLVFAGFGVLGGLWTLLIAAIGNPFLKLSPPGPQLDMQIAMQAKMGPATIITGILSLLVAIPMITAGILMLKKRKAGLKWSNIYAGSSLFAKLVNLVISITVVIPATNEMTRGIIGNSKTPDGFEGIMSGSVFVITIASVLVSCIYPVLSLILLNRSATKAWFSALPR